MILTYQGVCLQNLQTIGFQMKAYFLNKMLQIKAKGVVKYVSRQHIIELVWPHLERSKIQETCRRWSLYIKEKLQKISSHLDTK